MFKKNNKSKAVKKENKQDYLRWLMWWNVDEKELQKQVSEYKKLKFYQSHRGISLLLILFSNVITVLFVVFAHFDSAAYIDALMLFVFGVFIYRGQRWAMVCAMILWTVEKLFALISQPHSFITNYLFWTAFMSAFYSAFKVEQARKKLAQVSSKS